MPDEPTSTETEEQSTESTPEDQASAEGEQTPAGDETPAAEETPEGDEPKEDDGLDLDGAKKALSAARKDAAKYRTKVRDLEKKLDGAKTPEEIEAIKTELKTEAAIEARSLLVENVALAHGLPADLADALKGETREELEAHAKTLQKYAPSAGGDDPELKGGLNPNDDPNATYDPQERARQLRAARNRGF